jgi:adenine deaminase
MDMKRENLKKIISSARGVQKADLVLKNARILNVFTKEFEDGDVAISNGVIAGIGTYEGEREVDLSGKYLAPGLIDGHIHIESSMLSPTEFARSVVPQGTTMVVTDPHEIANVAGKEGISFMLESSKDLPLDVFFMLPSCVPATPLDESGAILLADDLKDFYDEPRVLGLAELMNSFGTIRNDEQIISKILGAKERGKQIDGHGPALSGKDLNAYIASGVASDHECSVADEAIEKVKRGQFVMIREGTAAKNLEKLLPLFDEPYCDRCMLVTDDRHPGELINNGHIDDIVRRAIAAGKKPETVLRMASFNASVYFGLKDHGAVAPGYVADLIVLSDLEDVVVDQVYKHGELVAEKGKLLAAIPVLPNKEERYPSVYHSFHLKALVPEDFALKEQGSKKRVIGMVPGEILTSEMIVPANLDAAPKADPEGHIPPSPGVEFDKDIVKIAVVERHKDTGHIGVGFTTGYGLRYGAIASSVAHDSHNIIVVGTNDTDMAAAANAVRENEGGLAIAIDGEVVSALALPIAGLMCEQSAVEVDDRLIEMKVIARRMGVPLGIDPFMTLAFTALPVIPSVRILTQGIVDVATQSFVPVLFD